MDKYYVYRPLIDLIGKAEGTDKGDSYNETLGYGAYTGGDVELTSLTLRQIDALQTKMLKHPDNRWNSSAVGRSQIVRTTMRQIRKTLKLSPDALFDKDMQDRMTCYLLGLRGIDKWLSGRMRTKTLLDNLAHEWASFPKMDGKGAYSNQRTGITVGELLDTLEFVRRRHEKGQPKTPIPNEVEEVVHDVAADKGSKTKTLTGIGVLSALLTLFQEISSMISGTAENLTGLVPQWVIVFLILAMLGALVFAWVDRNKKQKEAQYAKEQLRLYRN